jgi:hypothetical protein
MMRSLPALAGKECVRPAQRRAVRSTDSAHVRFEREAASLRLPSLQPGMGLHAQHPKLPAAKMENSANCTTSSTTQCRSNQVSGRGLLKTGIFQILAGDYRLFRAGSGQIRSPETGYQFAKARHWRAFLRLLRVKSPGTGLVGWGERIRTAAWWNQNPLSAYKVSTLAVSRMRSSVRCSLRHLTDCTV